MKHLRLRVSSNALQRGNEAVWTNVMMYRLGKHKVTSYKETMTQAVAKPSAVNSNPVLCSMSLQPAGLLKCTPLPFVKVKFALYSLHVHCTACSN